MNLDRLEQQLLDAHARGELTAAELAKEMSALQREYFDAAREAAQRAHDDELERW